MRGLVFKTIGDREKPGEEVQRVREALHKWCDAKGITPTECWAGNWWGYPRASRILELLNTGVSVFWMPTATSANTQLNRSRKRRGAPVESPSRPLEELGDYLLDKAGNLKAEIKDVIRLIADHDKAFSFGHGSHAEMFALAEEVYKIGFKKSFVDHPFSPYIDLSVQQMKELARMGVWINFTYDELSPVQRVDPYRMYEAIREIGVEHCIVSSDATGPVHPDSVECMRLMRAHMGTCGLTEDEVRRVSSINPGFIVGLELA